MSTPSRPARPAPAQTGQDAASRPVSKPRLVSRKVPFNAPAMVGDEFYHIADAIHRGQLSGDGHYTRACEAWLRNKTNARSALLTHSCTAALEMASILLDLGPGDEVVMPSYTFVSTANAVAVRGAAPVFVDIEPRTLNIDPALVEAAITPRTRAIYVVHYAGVVADMDAITAIAERHGLVVVEDAAQALGSTRGGAQAGSFGHMATFSFHETKNVISGEGGALILNDESLVERAEIVREKGTNRKRFFRGEVDKYTWVDVGSSYVPGELIAAFLYAQLGEEGAIMERRRAVWDFYDAALRPVAERFGIGLPHVPTDAEHNAHMYYLVMPSLDARAAFIAALKARGVSAPFHYVPLHSAPAGRRYGRTPAPMPVTDDIAARLVRLPLYHAMRDQSVVMEAVTEALEGLVGGGA